jgi:hypothetical protein
MTPELAMLNIGAGEIILIVAALAIIAFQIWMVIDCAVHETSTGTKVAWILVIVLFSCLGAPAYYFARKLPRVFAAAKRAYREASSAQPGAPPNGGPAVSGGASGASEGPPSVS